MKKVRISYTADFNEVPVEISNILQKSIDTNEEVNVFIKAAQKKALSEEVGSSFSSVSSARESLLKSVVILEDVLEILQGYGSAIEQLVGEVEIGETGVASTEVSANEEEKTNE